MSTQYYTSLKGGPMLESCLYCGSLAFELSDKIKICKRCGRTWGESPSSSEKCSECSGLLDFFPDRGETVCSLCGIVADEVVLDPTPSFERNLGEAFSKRSPYRFSPRDDAGKLVAPVVRVRLARMDKFHGRDRKEQENRKHSIIISSAVSALGLPRTVTHRASEIFKKSKMVMGRFAYKVLIPGSILAATKEFGIYLNLKELISRFYDVQTGREFQKAKARVYRIYKQIMRKHIATPSFQRPEFYVPLYVSLLERETSCNERDILPIAYKYVKQSKRTDGNPTSVALAAVYLAALFLNRQKLSIKETARIGGISVLTLSNYARQLTADLDDDWARIRPATGKDLEIIARRGDSKERMLIWKATQSLPEHALYLCAKEELHSKWQKATQCNIDALTMSMRINLALDAEEAEVLTPEKEIDILDLEEND